MLAKKATFRQQMSHSLNSLRPVIYGIIWRTTTGDTKGGLGFRGYLEIRQWFKQHPSFLERGGLDNHME